VPRTALELTVDGHNIASSTWEERAGAYTTVIATAIPELALRLHSTYVGSEHSDSIAVHLELGAGERGLVVRRYPPTFSSSSPTTRAHTWRSRSPPLSARARHTESSPSYTLAPEPRADEASGTDEAL